ncbi:GNAT family N-acetyltransferase [Lentibacillus sediminis]|uniref:GNAT family N-acetyltransferase n=1 Tax=Lentibacillus sediminis TaxID=1940529 RepID=UPI000C1C79B3|nr:GNAT family N-acetyltransferase [Lentibacillus sediminis]
MIRQLTKEDHAKCFQLLKTKPAENLFIIGDIEAYGYEQEFQKVWGEFNGDGELMAVLLKYEENYIPFAAGPFDAKGFAEIISQDSEYRMLSGLQEITAQIEPYIGRQLKRKRKMYYAKCTNVKQENQDTQVVQQALPEDAGQLVELLNHIPEFADTTITAERKRRGLETGFSRTFFIKEDGKMVSTASTTAENSLSGMVVSVAPLEAFKRKGYATKCMVRLCSKLLSEGKELCLFYDNPEAEAIYKRIGFEDIGFWMLYSYR